MPANANCASESCPAYPVTTTSESTTIAVVAVVVAASTPFVGNPNAMIAMPAAASGNAMAGRTRPVPTSGGRSAASLRRGSARPRTMSTTMMTRNGTARPHPCSAAGSETLVCRNATSLSSTPMSRPPASVSQNDRNDPTSAAAIPGTTSRARLVTLSPETLTIKIAATTASPDPSPQFAAATKSGEMPSIDGTRRFSATALVASPNRVCR